MNRCQIRSHHQKDGEEKENGNYQTKKQELMYDVNLKNYYFDETGIDPYIVEILNKCNKLGFHSV